MTIVLFSDQLADVRGHLRHVHQSRKSTVLVESFLERAYEALRQDACTLPREVRSQIPVFNGIFDLSERHHNAKTQRLEISSALLCISQLAHFFGFFEQRPNQYPVPGDDDLVVGFGLGQLSAAAVSCSKTLVDLIDPAVEAVHLAFQIGAAIERFSSHFQRTDLAEGYWNMTVGGAVEEIESELKVLQDQENIPISARAYVSLVDKNACNISGPPSRLRELKKISGLLGNASTQERLLAGFWHAPHMYGKDQVSEILESRLNALNEIAPPYRAVLSPSNGEVIQAPSSRLLFTRAVDDILRKPVQCNALQQTIAEHINSSPAAIDSVLSFEIDTGAKALISTLEAQTKKPIKRQDLSTWCSLDAKSIPHGRVSNSNIAIVGMSGRFPGATDHEMFWKLLEQGRDMHKTIPKDRFDVGTHADPSGKKVNASVTPYGCFIEEPGLFDPRFFNMSPREAAETDPMHRLALVTAYEALEQSGFVPNSTASTQQDRIGTFYGQTCDDWREVNAAQNIATYFIPGGVRAFAPGRISYYFGFRGPSYSIDTACSSSLAAIQIACTSLKTKECDTAVAGGVNILTAPDIFAGLSKGQFLSPTGSCKTWDEKADGYCRADGVGSVILKREEDAISDKDNILGLILATATNHSADAISITHPHAGNQSFLYESVLNAAGIDPLDVSYVEMHGTGTQAGDTCEMRSVTDVFAPESGGRGRDQALHIGAVKSNIGHGEAAAGIAALIKVLMMLQKNAIPPHVGIKNSLNPAFPNLDSRNVRIPFQKTEWPRSDEKPRVAFLNNFSAAGGNTAMILQDPPQRVSPLHVDRRSTFPFVISSKSISSMRNNVQQLISYTQEAPEASLASLSYTLTSRRMHHNYRVGVTASDFDALRNALGTRVAKGDFTPISSKAPTVVFVFTGQGAFYASLGKDLFELSTVFRSEIMHLNELAVNQELPSFLPAIKGSADQGHVLSTVVIHLALVSVQIALVKLWQSWGIKPSTVLGHSLGEYSALYAAGVLSKHDVLHLVGVRAKLLQEKCTAGTHCMLAVKASLAKIQTATDNLSFEVACLNSPNDTVLCGVVDEVDRISQLLTRSGYKCRVMDLPYAFHSAQIEPVLEDFKSVAGGVTFSKPEIPVISPLLGEVIKEVGIFNAAYLCRQAREPVDFVEALRSATDTEILNPNTVFVEIGSHPICSNMIKATLENRPITIASMNQAENPWMTISKSTCSLYCTGLEIDWRQFHKDFTPCHELLKLPGYKFDNKNHWIDYVNDWCLHKTEPREVVEPFEKISRLSTSSVHRIISQDFDEDIGKVVIQSDLSDPILQDAILGHLVNGAGLCPSSIYADIAFTLGDYVYKWLKPSVENFNMNCGEMEVMKPLIARSGSVESQILQVTISADLTKNLASLRYATVNTKGEETLVHATCKIAYEDGAIWAAEWASNSYLIEGRIETLRDRLLENKADQISRGLAYKLFSTLVQYGEKYQGMEEVILDSKNFEATSQVRFQTEENDGTFFLSPFWIDSLAHLSGFILNGSDAVDSKNFVYVSHGWKSLRIIRPLSRTRTYNSYVKMQPSPNNVMTGDVYVFEEKTVIGVVGGLKFQRIPRTMLNTVLPPASSGSLQSVKSDPLVEHSSTPTKAAKNIQNKSTKDVSQDKGQPPKPDSNSASALAKRASSSNGTVVSQVMGIISQESELPMSELLDDCVFSDLGIDSLMSLQICGKIRESLDIDIQSTVFVDCGTVGGLREYLQKFEEKPQDSLTVSPSSSDEEEDQSVESSAPSSLSAKSKNSRKDASQDTIQNDDKNGKETMMLFRTTIAEQMGIALEEVVGSNDLQSLGIDSLMNIAILGAVREKADLELPSTLFVDHPSIDAIEVFLGFNQPKAPGRAKLSKRQKNSMATPTPPSPSHLSPQAVSILMQGKPKTAEKILFLFPDGSGSATSYASIPAINPRIAIYGLNSPFINNPSDFTDGIVDVASIYLAEVRRRQPHGPYHLGGWSAGGIIAYEVVRQLLADNEHVESLVFFDSPCPIDLEPLPSRLHKFLADVGLLGGEGVEPPPWLLPHFEATIKALTDYEPVPIEDRALVPRTLAIWARNGVCGRPGDPRPETWDDDPKTMKWLLENRTDFGTNGWDALLGQDAMEMKTIDGHHFSLMKDTKQLYRLADYMREFLLK